MDDAKNSSIHEWRKMIGSLSDLSWDNLERLKKAKKCGCYYCCRVFEPAEIREFCSDTTAICPYCGVDSVVGDNEGVPITEDFLRAGHFAWFGES